MSLYAIGDLHLSLGGNKSMEVFGGAWTNYVERLQEGFSKLHQEDITVLCGDTSWGMSLEESLPDFQLIDRFPGRKILLKGNHDYWWNTVSKMRRFFAEHQINSIDILHNNCFFYENYALCGTRGWFYEEDFGGSPDEKIFQREVGRLETSLQAAGDSEILCFLHYPPLYQRYTCPEIISAMQKHRVKACYYGHLHGPAHHLALEGIHGGIDYSMVSADYLQFVPKKICDFAKRV